MIMIDELARTETIEEHTQTQDKEVSKSSIMLDEITTPARIKVIGVGGGGGNSINRMIEAGVRGIEFIAANTDAQVLKDNLAPIKIQLGTEITKGLGAGSNPEIGRQAALEADKKIFDLLEGADMVFITAGMGGGTGTGAAPIIAQMAREVGALTVAVVTKPFAFEMSLRAQRAEEGIKALAEHVDTLITIPNERLLTYVPTATSFPKAMAIADDVLRQAVQGIADTITIPGIINLDFADVRTVMKDMGHAIMGIGIGEGEHRAVVAAQEAIESPLLQETSIAGAMGLLINITGGTEITLNEIGEAAKIITENTAPDAQVLFGVVIDPSLGEKVQMTVIATGFREAQEAAALPVDPRHNVQTLPFAAAKEPEKEKKQRQGIFIPQGHNRTYGVNLTDKDPYEIPAILRKQMD